MAHKYRRSATGSLEKIPITEADLAGGLTILPGDMIPIPGKKPRRYRAPRVLGPDNKPLRPPITAVRKKGA